MKIADKIVSLGLASCILLAAPGAQAYDAAGQLAATRRHFNYSGSAFEYYLKLQGINSTRELARQSPGRQQYLSQDYEKLQQEILRHYEQFGLLQDPFWSPQLVTSGRSLTSLGLWFGLQLLTQGIPEEIQDYLHQAALDLSIKRPDPTQQKPAAIKRALAQLFDHAQRSGDANIVENSPPVRAAISEDAHSDSSDSTLFSGVASDRANVVPSAPLNSKLKTQNSKLSQESTAVFLEEPVVVAAEKSSGFFRTILGWLGWHKTQKFATDTVSQAGSLVEKNSARNIDDPAGGSENVQAASKDFDDQSEKEIPGPGTGVSLTAADRVSLAPQPAGAQLARVFDGQRGGVYLVSTAAGPVSIGSTAAAPANGAPAISERERREGQMALEEHLGNDSWLAQAGERDARMRRLATEMAAYNTLTADRTGDPKTGDPTLREQTQRLETTQAEVEQAIVSYQAAIKSEEDWRVTYQQLKELSRSEESMTQITKASSDLVAVLLLKRGYMFMDLALQKLSELEALMEAEKEENQANREELSGKEREAQRKLEIAKDLYDKALRGEFVREVDEYIAEVEEMLVYAEDAAELIVSVENILNGTVTGDLGGTFLDPSVVAEEISMWTDLQLEIEEQHDAAEEFVDVYRAISVREPDDFGDYHYVSAHLWAEELINQMESAQAAIQVSVDEFEELHKMREDPDLFYVGVKGDPQLQTDEEQEDLLILRREGESLINFGAGALEFKTAESTLNALQNAYVKDAGFAGDIGVEPYYDATISRMEESEKTAQETITIIQKGLEMERPLLVDELDVVTDADMDSLLEMIEKPYQSSAPEGLAHRAYDVMQDGKDLAEDALEFYNWKMSFLSSGPSFFEILDSDLIQMQSELVSRQVEFANKLLDFLRQYYRPSQEALTDTYAGLVSLYETGYGTLYEAEGTLYDKESEGLETMEETIAEIAEPFQVDFETIKSRLAMLNDMDDPAIRRLGRALSDAGDELLTRLNSKKFLIHAREERERKQRDLKESLERLRLERERTQELLNRGNPEDPNFYKAWDLVQRGNLLYDPEGFDDDSGSAKPGALFVRQDSVQKILLQASAMTGNTPSVQDWVRSLGLSDYEVFPVGSGSDSFYTVVHFAIGTSPSLETFDENILEESLIKFGNLGSLIGHNVSVSLYDFKDLEVAVGSRGIRTTFERDKENEKYINTTVIDIHNNLQQGHIFRALIFENMAFMTLGDRLFISANGYGDLPMIQGQAQHCLAEELGLSNCDSMPFSYSSENDDPPYIVGGRAKGVFYFHEVASLNAEAVRVFAQDPHTLEGYINTSLDPLDMNEEYFTIEGAILNYLKLHGGVTIDLAKIFSEKQTFAIEFFMEKETATETDNGAVSEEYLENYADNYDKLWKGAQLIKEINFKLFGHQTRLAMETRAAWDQDNALEVAEELSFYFPKGFSLSLAGARYGGDLYGKVSVNSRIAPGTDLFLSYGNDRINTDMDLMIGLSSTLSIEQFRRNAASSAERAMAGGQTLSDFQRGLEKTFDSEGRGNGDAGATQALPLEAAMMRALTHDAGIAALTNAIGIKEQETRQLRRVVEAGLSGQGGIVLGEGFTDMVTGNDQNSYGYWSTAGGLQVGVAAFFGLTQPQKKEALKEIVQMKVLLLDLKEAYEKAMDEFRLGVLRVILARLRLKQLEALKDRTEIGGNPLLRSQLDLNIIQAVKERAIEEAALRARIGLSSKDPLPKEIEEIFINPNNPQETIDAAMKAAGYPGGWNKLLVKIAEANPNKAARPPLYSPERIFEAISPLQLLPFIDALTISAGTTLEDSLGNSQASIGASVEITLWDPERGLKRKSVLLEADMADLRAAERLAADRAQNDPYIACFDRWALGTEKKNFESVIPKLWAKLAASRDLAEQLSIIDQITLVNREISRIVLESFSVPGADCPKETRQKLALSGAPRLLEEAKGASSMLAELELQRQSAGYLEKAARRRVQLKTSLGITYNPVDNLWFETPATFFISDAWSWLIPALNLTIKHKASKEADTDYSQALIKASEADFKIQTLELTQQIITSYLRLVFAKSIKDELVAKAKGSTDPAEIARLNVDILELRRSITHESQKLIILLGKDPAQFEVDLETLARLKPQETAESLRPWSEANLKGAPGVQLESLRTRLELVRALEAQLLIDERSMNIKTEPVSALLQVAAQLIGSFFGDGGDTTSMVDLQALTRYRQDLERQIREWEAASGGREREAEIVLARAQKAWQDDPTFLHLLGRELAWVSQASGGFDRPLEYSYLPRSNTREMAPVIQYKARIYDAEQGICADPALCTKDGDRRPTSEVGEGSVYYDGRNTKKATFYEGFVQILLRRPELVNPRLMVKAEELQQEHQARLEWLEKDLRQARLFGLVWKYNYLNGQLSHAVDESTKKSIEKLMAQTQEEILIEFGLKSPEEYPAIVPPQSTMDPEALETLMNISLQYLIGDAPILGALRADLALGQLEAQAIIDNLRYQSMNPSFVLGYFRNGIVGGLMLSAPLAGITPGAELFRDLDRIIQANMTSVLEARSLAADARERLARNYFEFRYLIDEVIQRQINLNLLRRELSIDPFNPKLTERYYQNYEDLLLGTSRLHQLYLQIEMDLKLLGVN
ncbi:MAG: hypothetical protein HY547_08720, partial [Elusimicrobia bacterium]|nr:hypothetical protein [Elusimicrobiota bacterium]